MTEHVLALEWLCASIVSMGNEGNGDINKSFKVITLNKMSNARFAQ